MKKILAVLALVAATLALTAAPASAAPGCSAGWICFHNTSTSSPNEARDGVDTSPGECHPFPAAYNNTTSYVTNNTGRTWYVFLNGNCTGSYAAGTLGKIYAHTSGAMTGTWDNSISSYRATVPGETIVAGNSLTQ